MATVAVPPPGGGPPPRPSPLAAAAAPAPAPAPAQPQHHPLMPPPASVEEAGALLGAAITRYSAPSLELSTKSGDVSVVPPPPGVHSSFATISPVPGSELYVRLVSLRAVLRSHAGVGLGGEELRDEPAKIKVPLTSAPSLLAVCMKIFALSPPVAAAGASAPIVLSSEAGEAKGGGVGVGRRGHVAKVPVRLVPPMLSTPLRSAWVDCVVLCHRLGHDVPGGGLSGSMTGGGGNGGAGAAANARGRGSPAPGAAGGGGQHGAPRGVDAVGFLRRMMDSAMANPRSSKAAGGTRIAALEAISGLLCDPVVSPKVAPWCHDVLDLCKRSLRSSGSGEPHYRLAAVEAGCAVLRASRASAIAASESRIAMGIADNKVGTFVVRGGLEDRTILEAVKISSRAADDKFPEVREAAAKFAGLAASVLISTSPPPGASGGRSGSINSAGAGGGPAQSPLASLDETMHVCLANLDDESAGVALLWAEALARCICASVEYGEQTRASASAESSSNRSHEVEDEMDAEPGTPADLASKFKAFSEGRGKAAIGEKCSSLPAALDFLVNRFVKCGGEYAAAKCGGTYSAGARAPRVGLAGALTEVFRLQSARGGGIGPNGLSTFKCLRAALNMVGPDLERQLNPGGEDAMDVTSSPNVTPEKASLSSSFTFGATARRHRSPADAGVARLAANRVIRNGLSELANEPLQLKLLQELASLCMDPKDAPSNTEEGASAAYAAPCNRHQLQVALIEISHLVAALGEAAASSLEDVFAAVRRCLCHPDHGVRHEAAIAFQAVSSVFPSSGRAIISQSLTAVQETWSDLIRLASTQDDESSSSAAAAEKQVKKGRFRRGGGGRAAKQAAAASAASAEKLMRHQYVIHGNALAVSMLLPEVSQLPGGLSTKVLDWVVTVAHSLINCHDNDILAKQNAGVVCSCVRAGYCMISGALTLGPDAVASHIASIFRLWHKSGRHAEEGSKCLSPAHELVVMDAMLASVVTFLKSCPDLLLAVPDALNRTTLLLEKVFPVLSPGGRFGSEPDNPAVASRLESAKASLMETFAWLPPGSFAFAADRVFAFATSHIKRGTENETACSIISSLVTSEDKILDLHSPARAEAVGQTGGVRRLEDDLVALTSEAAHHSERESVLHFLAWRKKNRSEAFSKEVFASPLLDLCQTEEDRSATPTPLHGVGTWRQPSSPSSASKVRLVDASIHSFAATFGMQDGRSQEAAMRMLAAMLPASVLQNAPRSFGVSSALSAEAEKRTRTKQEVAVTSNIAAVLLACLQALPLHEASSPDIPIGMGPPWMQRAKDMFFTALPSCDHLARRAASEGLALLATLGVTEDAHTLQSSILHSLDALMQGNLPDGTPRRYPLPNDALSSVRAASLLTLASIQRTAQKMDAAGRDRAHRSGTKKSADTAPQTMIMLTRVLPSLATHGGLGSDFFYVRAHALHAFGLLMAYSVSDNRRKTSSSSEELLSLSAEQLHILRKAVEIVESNFLSAWTAVSGDLDKGREGEKFAAKPAVLSVLLRLMTFLVPWLDHLRPNDPCAASRFASMASDIVESCESHPGVIFEALVFFERLGSHADELLARDMISVTGTENALALTLPLVVATLEPSPPQSLVEYRTAKLAGCAGSVVCQRAAVRFLDIFSSSIIDAARDSNLDVASIIFALLESRCGFRHFNHAALHRSISANRDAERGAAGSLVLETEIVKTLEGFVRGVGSIDGGSEDMLRWLLFARSLLAGATEIQDDDALEEGNSEDLTPASIKRVANALAHESASMVHFLANAPRWQVKAEAAKIASVALNGIFTACLCSAEDKSDKRCPDFNPLAARKLLAKRCRDINQKGTTADNDGAAPPPPVSFVALHLESLISAACGTSIATLNQGELPTLQNAGLRLLMLLVEYFGDAIDPESAVAGGHHHVTTILSQYSSQIMSTVKHSLTDHNDGESADLLYEGLPQLFLGGCEALLLISNKGVIPDPNAMRRMIRPVLPSKAEVPYCVYPGNQSDNNFPLRLDGGGGDSLAGGDDGGSAPFYRVAKLATLAELHLHADTGAIPAAMAAPYMEEIEKSKKDIAVNCAALVIDAAHILSARGLSLSGDADANGSSKGRTLASGLTFACPNDLDPSVEQLMIREWPIIANLSAVCLAGCRSSSTENDDDEGTAFEALQQWMGKLVPIILAGLHDSLSHIQNSGVAALTTQGRTMSAPKETLISCLHGIRAVVDETASGDGCIVPPEEIDVVVRKLFGMFLAPTVGTSKLQPDEIEGSSAQETKSTPAFDEGTNEIVHQCCGLFESLCAARSKGIMVGDEILKAILLPLTELQAGRIIFDDDGTAAAEVVASSIRASRCLVSTRGLKVGEDVGSEHLGKALLPLAVSVLSPKADGSSVPDTVKEQAASLLRECTNEASMSPDEKRTLARASAARGNWEAWSIVCAALDDGSGMSHSIPPIKAALCDSNDGTRSLAALAAIQTAVQDDNQAKPQTIGYVMNGLGTEVILMFKSHGTQPVQGEVTEKDRIAACAGALKIIMIAFQYLTGEGVCGEEEMSAFLAVVFEAMVSVVQFNGLPNHPSGNHGADPSLGRMCAQAMVHIARSSPTAFRSSMAFLSADNRSALEMAVRADMCGYAAPRAAPLKKKLNLKGFKSRA